MVSQKCVKNNKSLFLFLRVKETNLIYVPHLSQILAERKEIL